MAVGDAFLDKEARDEMPCRNCSGVRENSGLSARGFLAWKGARFLSLLRTDIVPYDEVNKESTCVFHERC